MMNQLNSNTKSRTFKHLSASERGAIAALLNSGKSITYISKMLHRS
ncbi:helix-turn-helix domain-containing protein, partial [Peptostreptococcus faecalis]